MRERELCYKPNTVDKAAELIPLLGCVGKVTLTQNLDCDLLS